MKTKYILTGSPIPAIEALRFHSIPKDVAINVVKCARHGAVTLYLSDTGKIHSPNVSHTGYYGLGRGRFDDYLSAAQKMGLISRADLAKHFAAATVQDKANSRHRRAYDFKKEAERLGVVLTKSQLKKL